MKKILAILIMALFMGCASVGQNSKTDVVAPPPAPSQEEVLKQTKAEEANKQFMAWWMDELPSFQLFMTIQMEMPLDVEVEEMQLLFDEQIGAIWVRLTNMEDPTDYVDMFIIATKPMGKWNVASIVVKELPPAPGEKNTGVKTNGLKL